MKLANENVRDWALSMRRTTSRPRRGAKLVPSRYSISVELNSGDILLFNSATRAFCRLDLKEAAYWRGWVQKITARFNKDTEQQDAHLEEMDQCCHEVGDNFVNHGENATLQKMLLADGFLVDESMDELGKAKADYMASRNDPSLLMLTLAPTMACNLACGYCFQGLNKNVEKIDRRLPDAIVDFAKAQVETIKGLNITWYGGEPLMAKKEIFSLADRLISLCDKRGIQYSSMIVTNGYFLTAEVAQQLWSRRCTTAQVTIDGIEETHDKMRPMTSGRGSFATIMKNLEAVLDETPMGISLRVNVGRRNVDECDKLLEMLDQKGYGERSNFNLYFAPIDAATPESGTAFEEGLKRLEFNRAILALGDRARSLKLSQDMEIPKGILGMCVAARSNGYTISHNGDVHKCWETAHDPTKRIGTIFEPEKLGGSLNAALWDEWVPFENEVCGACKILPMCGGFCGHRFIYHGAGNETALPCPDWKWNTAEYLFARAKAAKIVSDEDWKESEATSSVMQSGERHSTESLKKAQDIVLEKVASQGTYQPDVDFLLRGDGRFFEPVTSAENSEDQE